ATIRLIKGWGIEEKEYWVQRFTSYEIEKKKPTEIYPLDWWIKERNGLMEGAAWVPMWFQVVDAIRRRSRHEQKV
ncbi:hypothetical protein, partial [Anaerotignum sp.]